MIRVFSQKKIQSIELEVIQGSYQVHSAEGFLLEINDGQSLKLQVNSLNQIHVAKNGDFIGVYDTLSLFQSSHFDYIRLSPELLNNSNVKSRQYEGDFEISAFHGHIQVLNSIFLESFLPLSFSVVVVVVAKLLS